METSLPKLAVKKQIALVDGLQIQTYLQVRNPSNGTQMETWG